MQVEVAFAGRHGRISILWEKRDRTGPAASAGETVPDVPLLISQWWACKENSGVRRKRAQKMAVLWYPKDMKDTGHIDFM
jgi:hypothetical protein